MFCNTSCSAPSLSVQLVRLSGKIGGRLTEAGFSRLLKCVHSGYLRLAKGITGRTGPTAVRPYRFGKLFAFSVGASG